jgi:hypothetical protein
MTGTSELFDWGVFLASIGAAALILLAVVRLLLRQVTAMSRRLVQTNAVVEPMEGPLVDLATRVAGQANMHPLQYRYQVAGQSYTGSLVTLDSAPAARLAAEAKFAMHQPGDTITVFYDRDHPSRSVLDASGTGIPGWARFGWVPALAVLVVGIVMAIVGY